jgi:hypothetical protein
MDSVHFGYVFPQGNEKLALAQENLVFMYFQGKFGLLLMNLL